MMVDVDIVTDKSMYGNQADNPADPSPLLIKNSLQKRKAVLPQLHQ